VFARERLDRRELHAERAGRFGISSGESYVSMAAMNPLAICRPGTSSPGARV
jgi:hypothetical protein